MGYVVIAICFPFLGGQKQQDHKCTRVNKIDHCVILYLG